MALVCIFSFWRGRRTERTVAAVLLVAWVASAAVQNRRLVHHGAQWAIFAIDLGFMLFLLAMMWRNKEKWLIWAFAYQLVLVLIHIASWLNLAISQWDFFTGYYIFSLLVLGALGVGAAVARRPPPAPLPPRTQSA